MDNGRVSDASVARATRRWVPVAIGGVTFLVVLVFLSTLLGDWAARNVEMRLLVTRIESSEAAMGAVQDEVRGIFDEYGQAEALSVQQRAELDARLAKAAADGRDAIAAAGEGVAEVRWLGWHSEIGDAQDAYLAHNRAWQEYMARAADDPQEFGRQQDAVNQTFEAAQLPLLDAVPQPPLFSLDDRVTAIFAPPPSESSDAQSA